MMNDVVDNVRLAFHIASPLVNADEDGNDDRDAWNDDTDGDLAIAAEVAIAVALGIGRGIGGRVGGGGCRGYG